MNTQQLARDYIASLPPQRSSDMEDLHKMIMQLMPKCKQWFLDGKNSEGKVVSNPNIGYGSYNIKYADGSHKEFYQVGLSANTTGISVYIMGIDDKKYLPANYSSSIGKASVTGYCIKFRSLKDINTNILAAAILDGVKASGRS